MKNQICEKNQFQKRITGVLMKALRKYEDLKIYTLPQALLIVWAASSDVNLGVVCLEFVLGLLDGPDDTLESVGDVGEVGDASTDDQDLALGMRMAAHQVDNSFRVFISLLNKFKNKFRISSKCNADDERIIFYLKLN